MSDKLADEVRKAIRDRYPQTPKSEAYLRQKDAELDLDSNMGRALGMLSGCLLSLGYRDEEILERFQVVFGDKPV